MSDRKLKQITFRRVSVGHVSCYECFETMRCSIDMIFIFDLVYTILKVEAVLNGMKPNVTYRLWSMLILLIYTGLPYILL